MDLKKQPDVNGPGGQQLGRSSRLDGPRTGKGEKSVGLTVLNEETEQKLGPGLEKEKAQPKQKNRTKNPMHDSVSSPQANVNKGKEKVEGDRDRMRHGRTNSNRKENLTKLPQTGNMHVTTSNGSGFRGSTSLV
ncbi:hypothetical protein OIU84_002844 [Salix udensis]|uniref:Uncharacterized protein n=1 Tax=Salix udensis TaxID=889485 RepID=A0AAD6K6H7_9ROSI|nr:hypothetical protein OIU84_002844 [Salix udensis]